jgi:hypothetical protein
MECTAKGPITITTTTINKVLNIFAKGRSSPRTPFSFLLLLTRPKMNWSRAAAQKFRAEAASLPVNFLAIVSWFALLRVKKSILRGLAAPRAKETIT